MADTFNARSQLSVGTQAYEFFHLDALSKRHALGKLPFSLKILLENLLRHEDGNTVTADDIDALAAWDARAAPSQEIAFTPARVLLQDFTGVPAVVDLAAMRDAMRDLGGDPSKINPLAPVELVIDHSVQVDSFGRDDSLDLNTRIEFERNKERYGFLRWGQEALRDFKVVPPGTGIVHQINLEHLARVVFDREEAGVVRAYPDTLLGTDSHTTMINGLGVLGWGVGGIEAEAAMLGQPVTMLIPQVVGFRLSGELSEGATATDLVLTVTQMLRKRGVVGMFVEFYGDGMSELPLADRATIANMAPEYGATCGIFPIDHETLRYLALTGRSKRQLALVEAYARRQGLFHDKGGQDAAYTDVVELDLKDVEPSLAGPTRPQDRIGLRQAKTVIGRHLHALQIERNRHGMRDENRMGPAGAGNGQAARGERSDADGVCVPVSHEGASYDLRDGAVVIAAITSCTNTSNPHVMVGAGLLARNANAHGLRVKPWVKTSLAPGSKVVKDYLEKAELLAHLESLGFHLVGYGCTTCIGNSGPLPEHISQAVRDGDLIVSAVLSGNRNFEGRIHADARAGVMRTSRGPRAGVRSPIAHAPQVVLESCIVHGVWHLSGARRAYGCCGA